MKYSVLLTAAALFAAFHLAAADPKADLQPNLPNPDAPVEIRVTTGDANKEVKAKVGEIIVVELESYAADSYYSWTELPGRSESVLEAEGRDSKMREYAIGMVRAGDSFILNLHSGVTRDTFWGVQAEEEYPGTSRYSEKVWDGSLK